MVQAGVLAFNLVLHACWSGSELCLWGEDAARWSPALSQSAATPDPSASTATDAVPEHPFAASTDIIAASVIGAVPGVRLAGDRVVDLALPTLGAGRGHPTPSDRMAADLALTETRAGDLAIARWRVPAVAVPAADAARLLESLFDIAALTDEGDDRADVVSSAATGRRVSPGRSVEFFAAVARMARHLLAQQRFVPMLRQQIAGDLRGVWQPWTSDEATARRLSGLIRAMPAAARAAVDSTNHDPVVIVEAFLTALIDAECRRVFAAENLIEAVQDRDAAADLQVAWLQGLLGESDLVPGTSVARTDMARRVRTWISGLEERGKSAAWRLCLRLNEPVEDDPPTTPKRGLVLSAPADATWTVTFHLQAVERHALLVDAADIWLLSGRGLSVAGRRIENPSELLLGELGRASRIYRKLESALDDAEPVQLELNTRQAYEFLREVRPVLIEQGFGVVAPDWWDTPAARLGTRLKLESDELPPGERGIVSGGTGSNSKLGLGTLVKYRWEIALGDTSLTLAEFEQLAKRETPLVRVNGRWVEVRPEDVHAAVRFIRDNPGGDIRIGDALRMAYGADTAAVGLPLVGLEATGWVRALVSGDAHSEQLVMLPTAETFLGTLRPYQIRGVSWMAFLERFGLGACLADDMGLGKTIQLLGLLAHEREVGVAAAAASPAPPVADGTPVVDAIPVPEAEDPLATSTPGAASPDVGATAGSEPASSGPAAAASDVPAHGVRPTLLVVPMSVVGNWIHETRRFCPHLKVLVHHGLTRLEGDRLVASARLSDLVITTYALAHRDRESLGRVHWGRVVLDEAQYIKNPAAKQTQAVRQLMADRRIALTGTPVENRLSELWSIMEFLNPGYLGSPGTFRTRFAVPVERYHDRARAEQLRGFVRPFILRRLKTDPAVVADLPEKIESREYAHLTSEQASLYESCVKRMLGEVDQLDGIRRRGAVLAALIKLKQICNHPSQLLKDWQEGTLTPPDPSRSGKCVRLLEMLDEVLAEGDQALVFTQFRQMGHLLSAMVRHRFGRDVLFLHGGTPQKQRQEMVERFQKADGLSPILLVSLRAGGVGLNLTAATHVFHFDRWWNPAVENQATDRAYRIGQTRTVQVHKFVVRGTLEERIDEMIEQKTELAANIIGAGERWLTELSTDQLRDILTLRGDTVGDEIL